MKALTRDELLQFVGRAEAGPFDSVSLGQRLTFATNDPMLALTFAAAVTERIRLLTSVICLPYHKEGVLAQQAATLDRLSDGRFSFGIGLGGRPSDFAVAPETWGRRGERFERQLIAMKRCWQGLPPFEGTEPVGPPPYTPGGPEIIIGGMTEKSLQRAGRLADGIRSFSFATNPTEHLRRYAMTLDAWKGAGREGRPKLIAATHFALGPKALETYEEHVFKYYGYDKSLVAAALAGDSPTSPDAILSTIARFEDAGVDELVFTATTADSIASLDRLADVIARR